MTLIACILTSAILLGGLASPVLAQQVVFDRRDSGGMVRFLFGLNNGDSTTLETHGCAGSADTYMYLLENNGTTASGSQRFITRGANDDASGLGFCSRISFTNSSGSAKFYTLLLIAYGAGSSGYANLYQSYNGGALTLQLPNVFFGGVREPNLPWTATDTIMTKPLRPGEGGGPDGRGIVDTMVFAINSYSNTYSFMDDDSGPGMHSVLKPDAPCVVGYPPYVPYYACHIISGGFNSADSGNTSVWFIPQSFTDNDTDGVPDSIESYYGTSTSSADTDVDNISDYIELIGYVAPGGSAGVDGNSIIFPYLDAAPTQADMYWEIDYMDGGAGHSHIPNVDFVDDIVATYQGDWSWTGRFIRPHIDISQDIGHYDGVDFEPCQNPMIASRLDFYTIKNNASFFDPKRKDFFHYIIAGHRQYKPLDPVCNFKTAAGIAEIWGNDVIISLIFDESRMQQRAVYIHEVGHNLNLVHNGNDDVPADEDDPIKASCVHTSVMNYRYVRGWGTDAVTPLTHRLSYSRGLCESIADPIDGCSNTCTGLCVPNGQLTPKKTCTPFGSSFLSNGSCDCDVAEWAAVRLDWLNDGGVDKADGPPVDAPHRPDPDPHLMGDGTGMRVEHWERAHKKRAALVRRRLLEGADFRFSPRNGKIYME